MRRRRAAVADFAEVVGALSAAVGQGRLFGNAFVQPAGCRRHMRPAKRERASGLHKHARLKVPAGRRAPLSGRREVGAPPCVAWEWVSLLEPVPATSRGLHEAFPKRRPCPTAATRRQRLGKVGYGGPAPRMASRIVIISSFSRWTNPWTWMLLRPGSNSWRR